MTSNVSGIMSGLLARLESLTPIINDICKVSGTPGVSIGVSYRKQILFTKGYGFRDVERKLAPDFKPLPAPLLCIHCALFAAKISVENFCISLSERNRN